MNYDHLLYKRGYLFSQAEVEAPVSTWAKKTIGDYFISFDPENRFAFSQEGSNWVAFLGRAIDILHWSMDIHAIVRQCLDRLSYSEEKMLDCIDHLCGRFILIYHHGGRTKLMTDAFGTRSAFYSLEEPVLIASHCRIISSYMQSLDPRCIVAIKCGDKWQIDPSHGYPGNLTPFEGVYILTPNTLINIEERNIQRFYPRRELPVGKLSDVVEEVSLILKRQLELLRGSHDLVISLSAGLDTRTTLAAARDIAKDVLFFTYGDAKYIDSTPRELASPQMREWHRLTLETDLIVATEMAQALELRHIRLADAAACHEDFEGFNQILDCNTYHSHARRLAKAYLEQLPPNALHIRSNVSDIGKAFYRTKGFEELPLTAEKMAQAWKRMGDNELVAEAFQEFADLAQFTNILNYDPYDMFYWEHRDGTWLTCVLLESDVAFDTFELFNCRILAEKVLSVPVDQRIKSAIHYGVIKCLWPLLLRWPINEPPFRLQLEQVRVEENVRLKAEVRKLQKEQDKPTKQLSTVKNSFSFRLGNMMVQAVYKPGRNTILLPYRLIHLCVTEFKKRKSNAAAKGTGAN